MMKKLLFNLLLLLMVAIGAVAQQSLPYSYGFEDNDLSADGWTMSNCYSSTGINSSAAKTGTYGFRFYYRSNPPQYLISPELTGTTNGVQVEFYYKNSSSSYAETFQVGYSTTDNSTGSFTWGTEITASNQEWTLFSETFPANTKYVSVKLNSDDQFYLYLDDFEFAVPASCIKPNALTASNITHNSADFSWTQNSLTTDWVLEYSTNSDFSDATSKNVNGTPSYTLSNLNSTTTYYARVKADCGGGDESEWSDAISFSTTAVAEEVGDGWSDNFEGATCGWVLVNGTLTNAWAWGEAVNNGGSHAIYVSNDGGTTNAYTITSATMVYATKLLNFATGKYEFSYDWIANGESSWDYLRVALVPASVTLTAGTSVPSGFSSTALPSGWIALDGGSKLNLVTAWQTKELAVNVTAGNYYLVFAWRDDTSGGTNPPAAVDNVSITRVACEYDVTDLAVSNITTTGAKLTWTAGEASEWQVAYSTSSDFAGATEEIVSEATYNMTSLTSATTYYVKVRAYCGGSDYGAWSSVLEFPTACDAITSYPWEENFDSYSVASSYTAPSTRVLPICWNAINTTTYTTYQPFPTIFYNSSTNYANSTPNCLKLYSYYSSYGSYDPQPQYAILPQMENLNTKRIVLWARGYNANSTFKIGLMTDPTDASTFVQIGNEQTLTTSYQKLTINLTGTGNYIAIMIDAATSSRTNNGVYIDNITVEEQPTCLAPTALTVASYTANTATLTWTAGATESAWNLRYKADADWTVIEDVESPYTLSGLASDTDYEVQVQANCGSGDLSEWTNSVEFYTGYCQPAPTSVDGSGITNVSFGIGDVVVNNSERPTSTPYYGNYYTQIGAVQAGVEATVNITYGTGFTYGTIIWIDLNNNLIFDGEEVVYAGVSTNANPTTLAATFTLPASTPTGDYRMRIAGADSYYDSYTASIAAAANAPSCPTSSYTVVHDYTVRVLEAPSCVTPTALTVSNIMGRTANLAWTLGNDETAWQICLNDEEGNLINADSNPFTLTGLTPETTYQVKVRANCGGDGVSEWSANVSFTTTVSCLAPTALAATLTPGNGTIATLSWTENGTATDWVLEYGTEADFAGATSVNVNGTPSADLTGLTAESTYYARVKAACDVDDESAWSSTINFTPTDAYSVTLNDGTSTNSYVPVYGLYVDELSRSQFVIPASDLTDLQWGSINKLTFYSSNASVDWEDAEFDVRMKEVDNTTISSLEDWDGMSLAYHGSLGISGNVMEITFTTPYTYQGGNLLIGTNETTSGTYVSCYWYGVSATGSSLGGHDSSISQQNFLPKVTIEYTPGVAPVVNHTITATAGENGTITPNGETLVEDGESLQFTIAPADCYQIASVTVDDVDVTADLVDGVYTLTNVTADHTIAATFEMATYTITATEPENGTIIGAGSVNCGANAEITISPASCYQIASVTVDDVDVTADLVDGVYTFANVTANHTIAATFEQITYTITATEPENGTITGAGSVNCGANAEITISPASCYQIASVTVDDVDVTADLVDGVYTLTNVTANHTIAATFVQITYTITVNAGENGSITANDGNGNDANCGENKSFTVAPANNCYSIASVLVDGVEAINDLDENGVYTFANVNADHTIAATFEQITYTITATAGDNGSITPTGNETANCGEDKAFTIVANDGYRIESVIVDGETNVTEAVVAADGVYTFENVTANHTIAATFELIPVQPQTYTITATAGDNGSINPEGEVVVNEGATQAFTIAANEGYRIASVMVDEVESIASLVDGVYTFENVTADHTIAATFELIPVQPNTYTITATAGDNGSINPEGEVTVNEGATQAFTIAANEGYRIASVMVDETINVTNDLVEGVYTFENVMADHTIAATFELIPVQPNTYTITLTVEGNGSVTPNGENGVVTVNEGETPEFTITPDEGYRIASVVIDEGDEENEEDVTDALENGVYTFEAVAANHTMHVTFEENVEPITHTVTITVGEHGTVTATDEDDNIIPIENGAVVVNHGDDLYLEIIPEEDYKIDVLLVNGNEYELDEDEELELTLPMLDITEDMTISVTFTRLNAADIIEAGSMAIYPNPNNGMFSIDFSNIEGDATYQIINANGAVVETRDINVMSGETMNFNHDLRPGTYFVRIINGGKVYVEQIVVE